MRKIKNLLPIGLCLSMCVASLPGNLTLSTAHAHAANAFVTSDAFTTKSLPAFRGVQTQRTALTGQEWTGTYSDSTAYSYSRCPGSTTYSLCPAATASSGSFPGCST